MTPIYPQVEIQLTGHDGNAFAIMGRVAAAMKKANVPKDAIDDFTTEAMSGDYNNVLRTCMKYCTVS